MLIQISVYDCIYSASRISFNISSTTGLLGINESITIDTDAYMQELGNYIKISGSYTSEELDNVTFYLISDGVSIALKSEHTTAELVENSNKPHKIHVGTFIFDINGRKNPNLVDRDIFYYEAYDDGSVRSQN